MLWSKAIGAGGTGGAKGKTTAFISANDNSLTAFDISDPTAMTVISSLTVGARHLTYSPELGIIFASGDIGWNTSGVIAIDVSDPANMTVLGHIILNNAAHCAVDASGGVLYVASSSNLVSINISNPAAMVQLSSLNTGSTLNYVELLSDNETIYASTDSYLKKIDVSNPASMSVSSSNYLSYSYRNLGAILPNANETHILGALSNYNNVLSMNVVTNQISIANPTANSNTAKDLAYDEIDNVLYVTGPSSFGFSSVDVSDPTSPAFISRIMDFYLFYSGNTYGPIAVDSTNKLLFLTSAARNRITVFDVSSPASPVVLSHITTITNPRSIILA